MNLTKHACIEDIKSVAADYPDRKMSRELYRAHGRWADREWGKFFGTFPEFRSAAGLDLSRPQRAMNSATAKHASVDTLRVMTLEKRNFAAGYKKPTGGRFQTALIASDVHDVECCPFWRATFIDTVKRVQPEIVVLNGDIFDLPEFGKYSVDPREWDVVARIKWVHKFLEDIREAAPDTEINFVEGNHEYRLLRHLAEATPAMRAVLGDLHGWEVKDLLGLTPYEVNYIAPADLATFTKTDALAELRRNWYLMNNFVVCHHFPEGKNFGLPGCNGHHHSHKVDTLYNPKQGTYEWHQIGSGHKREASYCNGEKWSNGFLMAHMDTENERVAFEYIDTTNGYAVVGGKWYTT